VSDATAELAVHLAASAQNADASALCDSASFMGRVQSLSPDTPGFIDRVQQAVTEAVTTDPAAYRLGGPQPPAEPPAAPAAGDEPRQWTLEDVNAASPGETTAAIEAGLLRDLGHGPRRTRAGAEATQEVRRGSQRDRAAGRGRGRGEGSDG
jgi:hypothetical protein